MGSLGLANGSLGMTTHLNVSPVASKPSQNDRSARSDVRFSARNCWRSRRGEEPRSWHTNASPTLVRRGSSAAYTRSMSRLLS